MCQEARHKKVLTLRRDHTTTDVPKEKYSDDVLDVQEFCTGCFQELKLRIKSVMIQTVHKVQISQVQYAIKSPDVLAIVQQAVDVPVPQISEETVERTKQQRTVA